MTLLPRGHCLPPARGKTAPSWARVSSRSERRASSVGLQYALWECGTICLSLSLLCLWKYPSTPLGELSMQSANRGAAWEADHGASSVNAVIYRTTVSLKFFASPVPILAASAWLCVQRGLSHFCLPSYEGYLAQVQVSPQLLSSESKRGEVTRGSALPWTGIPVALLEVALGPWGWDLRCLLNPAKIKNTHTRSLIAPGASGPMGKPQQGGPKQDSGILRTFASLISPERSFKGCSTSSPPSNFRYHDLNRCAIDLIPCSRWHLLSLSLFSFHVLE